MSYCRLSTSDAYIFHHADGFLTCMSCCLGTADELDFDTTSYRAMIRHVREHRLAGHDVGAWVVEGLAADARIMGDEVREECGPNA